MSRVKTIPRTMFKFDAIPTASDHGASSTGAEVLDPRPSSLHYVSLQLAISDVIESASADGNLQSPNKFLLYVIAFLRDSPLR